MMVINTDALIVGAGPCGLFQIFELGLLGIKADILDSLPNTGGQCTELYPDKPIYDIPAILACTGQELVDALHVQIKPFGARFHLGEEVTVVEKRDDGFHVATDNGKEFLAKTLFIAGGVGSFQPRKLRFPEAESLEDTAIHYKVRNPDRFIDKDLVILGGGDSALDWAQELWERANSLTLVHRRDEYRGAPATVAALKELEAANKLRMMECAKAVGLGLDSVKLCSVDIQITDGELETLPVDDLLVFYGLAPKLGPIAEWGLNISKKAIEVDTATFQSNIPGIFAIGDISTYEGKKKLILSGFHEAALAAFAAKAIIEPGKKVNLQYTTTSPIMKKRLGVEEE